MGGFHSYLFIYLFYYYYYFFIESKLFQLVVEEGVGGRNFFVLKIFERGKYFMQSVFMGKNAALT